MLFNHNINNLFGGVSQQTEAARFDNQVEEMINFVPTIAQGLRRRNPLNHVKTLDTTFTDNMAVHSYDRGDGSEKYIMTFTDAGLEVFGVDGEKKTVVDISTTPNTVVEKWAGTDWKNNLKFLTVGDTTWIVNRGSTVLDTGQLTASDSTAYQGFYWLKRSFNDGTAGVDHGYSYSVKLQDASTYTYNHTDSEAAATELASQINAGAGSYTARAEGSIIYITRATDFTMSVGDSWGDQASIGWKDSTSKLSDLPARMDGFTPAEVGTVAITGSDRDNFTNYYLRWNSENWAETVAEGIIYKLDYYTMPCKVVRQSDGTFVIGWNIVDSADGFKTVWGERNRGDDDSNPMPSFVDATISNMFFYKNRLGFTSSENVILSKTADYYDFFATTVMEVLDEDPIDASADSNTISVIRNVNVTAGSVTLWSDTAQFLLSGGEVLSPATTRISQTSSYNAASSLAPISVDNEIMFFNKQGDWIESLTYSPATVQNDKSTAASLSAHVPEYLPSTVTDTIPAPNVNMVFMFTPDEPTSVYVYKYHIHNGERTMSAWFKWNLEVSIKSLTIIDNKLMVLSGTDGMFSIDLAITTLDNVFEDNGGYPYESSVTLSRFNIQTKQDTQNIRENFYLKTIVSIVEGDIDLEIINEERNSTKTVNKKHLALGRKILIGGHSDKVKLRFKTSYSTGVAINLLNIEGQLKIKSKNI